MNVLSNWRLLLLLLIPLNSGTTIAQGLPDAAQTILNAGNYREQPTDDAETRLLKERVRLAQTLVENAKTRFMNGTENSLFIAKATSKLLESQLEFHTDHDEQIRILKAHLQLAKRHELLIKEQFVSGHASRDQHAEAGYNRATIELRLVRAQKNRPEKQP